MSSRQLRKLQQQRELEKARALDIQEESSDEGEDLGPPGTAAEPRPNLFAALGGEDADQDDAAAAEEDGGEDEDDNHEAQPDEVLTTQRPDERRGGTAGDRRSRYGWRAEEA